MNKGFAIAIDGPVAAGKGTIAPKLAEKLSGFYLYTGAFYRALALKASREKVDFEDEEKLAEIAKGLDLRFEDKNIFLDDEDISKKILEPEVASASSKVAYYSKVREEILEEQRNVAKNKIEKGLIVVAEGRDTGTKLFPNAELKVFLTASPEIRAARRLGQELRAGRNRSYEDVLEDINERDKRDTEREADPLPKNPASIGYFIVEDTHQTKEETIESILEELKKRKLI